MSEAEDHAEWLCAGLALTIVLLSRNYDLDHRDFARLLTFPPADPVLEALQADVGRLAAESIRRQAVTVPAAEVEEKAAPIAARRRTLRSLWTH
jgi:hypothetical protein